MDACPQETTLSDFLAGVLSEEPRRLVMAHVEHCAQCQWVLAAGDGARALMSPSASLAGTRFPPSLERGTRVSRYVVRERLGSGAMGVVYAADDPELGRRVALKMLRPEGRQREDLQQRLMREAQALARLSHANVVTLYDVGTHGDDVYLAMELVEGTTLAEWMKEPRPWRDVLRVFLEAGRGLAAAHAAGLVHRDFKPANTLLGRDGRVCVTDFGIARLLHQEDAPPPPSDSDAPTGALTRTGLVLGTPAYLAPELLQGRRADDRSDQFSFCVALYEALYGVRPFQGETLRELAEAVQRGRVHPPERAVKVPARVRRAVLRGLRAEPSERLPSMEALLAALTPPPRRMLVRVTAAATVASVLGALVAYGVTHRREARCGQEVEKLAEVWSPTRRERVREAFFASGSPYATAAWERLAAALDTYATQWRTLRTEACLSAGRDAPERAWQTTACLDNRLWQLAAMTEVLEKADARTVRSAPQLADSLEGLTGCMDSPGMTGRPQPPDALRPRVDAARHELARARAHLVAGRTTDGLSVTSALLVDVKGLDYKPLEAETLLLHGELLSRGDRHKEAETFLDQALWVAEAARDDETAARAWLGLIWVVGEALSRHAEAEKLIQHARAAVERLGRERFPDITTDLHLRVASLRDQQGQLDEAEHEARQGLEFSRRRNGEDSLRTANLLHELGRIRYIQRRFQESLELHLQALEIRKRLLGPDNPSLMASYDRVGSAYSGLGLRDESTRAYRAALAIQDATSAPETALLATVLLNLSVGLRTQGHAEEARPLLERARAIFERARGPDHFTVVQVLTEQAILHGEAGDHAKAIDLTTDALERIQRSMGPTTPRANLPLTIRAYASLYAGRHPEARRDLSEALRRTEAAHGAGSASLVPILLSLAEVELAARAPKDALAYCERARKLTEQAQGPESEDGAGVLACRGEAHLALDAADKAVPLLERAWNIQNRAGKPSDPWVAGKTAFVLARALWARSDGADKARALTMADEARALLEPLGVRGRDELQKVLAWLRREARR
ncbi:tetratricopeptide repeat protein [Myxococcus stipitatus]|uniref:protein kinase domain-containing protein n=1 Tax=Myxococcus stipitatus TaxID=83455 RepID=UPI001F1C4202|nr:tetratricopeptide repeat protein [Myxococcus stipitatus]MCE9669932.1 tetratricopeptide repeat protein [Myxococcus stipitatus]